MSCTINQLPPEVLAQIFDHVRQPPPPAISTQDSPTIDPSIITCLLCSRRWHEISLPLLYRDVALQNRNVVSFTQRFRENNGDVLKPVRSLTVSLNTKAPVTTPDGMPLIEIEEEKHAVIHDLLLPLESLPAILSQMTGLATFSLFIYINSRHQPNRGTIGSILQSLPKSCVNLELDLDRHYNRLGTGLNHVCQAIGECLPRLHHLRLQLGTLCPDILGQGFSRSGSIKDEAQFRAPYPSLRMLIIKCGFRGDTLTCNEDRSKPNKNAMARTTLVHSLRELFLRGAFPNIERLWLLDGTIKHVVFNETDSATWNRQDIARNKTWAIPWTTLPRRTGFSILLVRLPDGQGLMTANHRDMAVLAEGQAWKQTVTGTRLPVAESDVEKGKHLMKGAPTISLSEYRRTCPNGTCTWWTDEAKMGISMVPADENEGLADRSLVLATTPSGWTWELVDGIPCKLVRATSATSRTPLRSQKG